LHVVQSPVAVSGLPSFGHKRGMCWAMGETYRIAFTSTLTSGEDSARVRLPRERLVAQLVGEADELARLDLECP
jgi:hypothetical protein